MNDEAELIQTLWSAVERIMARPDAEIGTIVNGLLAIADVAGKISPQFRGRHQSIPWLVLAEMAAVIGRAGENLDPREVAATVQRDIPELHQRLMGL